MRHKRKKLHWILVIPMLLATIMALIQIPVVKAESTAYYSDSGTVVTVHSCDLIVQITKARASYAQGARVTSIIYDGNPNIVNVNPGFGLVTVKHTDGTVLGLYPNTATLIDSSGNDTNKFALTFKCVGLVDGDGLVKVNVDATITYTFYSDVNTFFVNVLLESAQTDWLYQYSNYGTSMRFGPEFESYTATSSVDNRISSGSLVHDGSYHYPVDMNSKNILTVKDTASNIAVTLFSTSFKSQLYGQIVDGPAETRVMIRNTPPRTWDKVGNNQAQWYEGASYWGSGISYSCGWAFSTGGAPFMVTPWIMPSATPYGLMWTLDDLPSVPDGYNHYPPDPAATSMGNLTTWLHANNRRKVTILWVYDPVSTPQQTPVAGGFDGSWETHGNWRVANMSEDVKSYYDALYNNQVQYGTHAYHHDYPWTFEFSSITNTTNLDSTWNQIYQDAQAFLGNITLDVLKPAGYRAQPQILNVITKYGIEHYDAGADPHSIPMLGFFVDDVGNKLIISNDQMAISDDVNSGISNTTIYNDIIANASAFGLVTNAGHWLSGTADQTTFNEIFDSVDSYFGGNFTYFYADDINNYWNDVLWDNSYTFNSTQVSSTSSDSRLTYKLWNKPTTFTENGVHPITEDLILYSPNAPIVNYVDVWSYPDNNWVPQGGTVTSGHVVRLYAGVTDPGASVEISYGPSGGSLTTVTASYESTWDYYYIDWLIPSGATSGLYDVKVESGVTSITASGRFQVGASAPVVNYIDVWSYPDNNWIPQGGVVARGHTARIYAGIADSVVPVSISYGLQGGSWVTVTASYESTWNYYYIDWAVPYGAALGVYDVQVESGVTSTTATGRFQVGVSAPVVNYVDVWSYPDNNYIPQGGTVIRGHRARIYAGVANAVAPVSISYRVEGGSWVTVAASYELTWDYYYIDWAVPYGAAIGVYDVKVESGVTSVTATGRFQVGASAPVVNYIDVWSYPDNNWVPQGGVVTEGHTVRIYAGVSNPVAPVSISYRLQGGSWVMVTASYESTWDYYYIDWAISYGAAIGVYDVQVESGVTSTMASGRFQVGAQDEYVLTVAVDPLAGGSVSPDKAAPYHLGDVVTLTPTAASGYTFDHWSGDGVAGVGDTWVVTMDAAKSVTATFTQDEYVLTVAVDPLAGGSVVKVPDQATYAYGTVVTLTATPGTGYVFDRWEINALPGGSVNPYFLTVDSNKVVTAFFRTHPTPTTTPMKHANQ